ncbi:radical SAM protein [Rhizobium sp. L9]|uniref:4Fe-4S single cluster domain-containing protein n=1 Tax=Rhizobium sp. L9 TaxID=1340738 RepID=UPI000BE7C786|nr:4Fe-4S single cluster domain-containing protein [Rhizobium sp. L9]PDT32287.1 radical SAM protein [Rhizobium sp. L9]
METIAISRIHFPVTTLGPGRRIGIWFQGCSIRCPGCISADTWTTGKGMTTIEEVVNTLQHWLPEAEGVTVSGGEPFDQREALQSLLSEIRSRFDGDVLVYSGYPVERLTDKLDGMTGLIDALISDPYLVDAPQTLALRGSDNQRLNILTPLGQARLSSFQRETVPSDRRFDLMMGETGEIWMAGIPGRDDFNRLTTILASQAHKIVTTQDRSAGTSRRQAND